MKSEFGKTSFFSVTKKQLFEFHERKDAFTLLTPESEKIDVVSTASTLAPSDEVVRFVVNFLFFKFKFANVHTVYEPYDLFVDEQKEGLFTYWKHEHRFKEGGWKEDLASMLDDRISFAHPLLFSFKPFVTHKLGELFAFRHGKMGEILHEKAGSNTGKTVIVTGATGLLGKRIVEILHERGDRVIAFVRNTTKAKRVLGDHIECAEWDFSRPHEGDWKKFIEQADSIIHLAGTPLFKQRWNPSFKVEMEESRVLGTRRLVDAIAASSHKPASFVSASALGYYGTNHEWVVDEESEPADDLLAKICLNWENETHKLEDHGIRPVQMRIGIVLSTESGALKEMLPLFKTGMGGVMGRKEPFINWIHLEDVCRMFVMALDNPAMHGPYNAIAPTPVTNGEFAREIGIAMNRPCLMHYPVAFVKAAIGEAAEYASGGPRASCNKIEEAGYRFFFDEIGAALSSLV